MFFSDIFTDISGFFVIIFSKIVDFATAPFLKIISTFVPDLNSYIDSFTTFFTNYIFKGFQFMKMILINLTGISQGVWQLLCTCIFVSIYLFITANLVKLAYNLWCLFRGTQKVN